MSTTSEKELMFSQLPKPVCLESFNSCSTWNVGVNFLESEFKTVLTILIFTNSRRNADF